MIELLAQVEGRDHKGRPFCAGIVLWDDVVVEAAPIVHYMKRQRWTRDQVRDYCAKRGWTVTVVSQSERRKEHPG